MNRTARRLAGFIVRTGRYMPIWTPWPLTIAPPNDVATAAPTSLRTGRAGPAGPSAAPIWAAVAPGFD